MANAKGTYALVLALDRETTIAVGRLGVFTFPAGCYVYAGSALGGLSPRLRRHFAGGKKVHWHVDYLREKARSVEAWYHVSDRRLECAWFEAVSHMDGARVPVDGFGSSGCRCRAHLVYFAGMPSFEEFRSRVGEGIALGRVTTVEGILRLGARASS